jgi:hypothetical protein
VSYWIWVEGPADYPYRYGCEWLKITAVMVMLSAGIEKGGL